MSLVEPFPNEQVKVFEGGKVTAAAAASSLLLAIYVGSQHHFRQWHQLRSQLRPADLCAANSLGNQ